MQDEDSKTTALRSELRRLGDLEAPAAVWEGIERALPRRHGWRLMQPLWAMAMAAGVVAAAALTVFVADPFSESEVDPLADLMQRSRELETRIASIPSRAQWGDTSRVLVYRISNVDRSLNRLSAEGSAGSRLAEAELLRRRVELMESLVAVERRRRPELLKKIAH
jgi:hypothetical protein